MGGCFLWFQRTFLQLRSNLPWLLPKLGRVLYGTRLAPTSAPMAAWIWPDQEGHPPKISGLFFSTLSSTSSGLPKSSPLLNTFALCYHRCTTDLMEALYNKDIDGTLAAFIDKATLTLHLLPLPRWLQSSQIKVLLKDEPTWRSVVEARELQTAPGLEQVLSSETPPPFAFFKSLPSPSRHQKQWAIYVLCLEKPDCKPRLYVGSGTESQDRVLSRFRGYDSGRGPIPQLVQRALDEGYTITHKGLLAWIDLPEPGQTQTQRARTLVLEAVFTILFVAARRSIIDQLYIEDLYRWKREDVEWDPLCTHLSFTEKVSATAVLSPAELEACAIASKARNVEKTQRYRKRKRDEDEVGFKAAGLAQHQSWAEKNRDRINEIAAGVRNKAKAENRFPCTTCKRPFATDAALASHLKTDAHQEALLNGGPVTKAPSVGSIAAAARRAENIRTGRFRCTVHNQVFPDNTKLQKHYRGKLHRNN